MVRVSEATWAPRQVERRSAEQLKVEWDAVAAFRHGQITSGRDLSYLHVLTPCLLGLLPCSPRSRVLDAGCGSGHLAGEIARRPRTEVVGIDPSASSIQLARETHGETASLRFHALSAEEYAAGEGAGGRFDVVIANMVLENVPDLEAFLGAVHRLLRGGGTFLVSIPHPCFWPRYWGYESSRWFAYDRETWIEAPFRTSLSTAPGPATTHAHRSLSAYLDALSIAGFRVERTLEHPDRSTRDLYPEAKRYPRFLVLRCRPLPAGA